MDDIYSSRMEEPKKFCVYAADNRNAYIAQLEERILLQDGIKFRAVRYYEIDRNALVEDMRPLAKQALINARFRKYSIPELSRFLLEYAEKDDFPDEVEKERISLRTAEAEAKRSLYSLYKEAKRELKEKPKKPYRARIKTSKKLIEPENHCIREGRVFFASLDETLNALYHAWKDLKNDWDKDGELKEMFHAK